MEATASYDQILRQAAREAVDGNDYIREARWHRDLEIAIAMEDLRYEQRPQSYTQDEQDQSQQRDQTDGAFQAEKTSGPDVPQITTRLHQIEQEIAERSRADRDERDR